MAGFVETDDLNRLIRSLNDAAREGSPGNPAPAPELELVRGGDDAADSARAIVPGNDAADVAPSLVRLLAETVRRGGSDLLLVPGASPMLRLHGALHPVTADAEALGAGEAADLLSPSLNAARRKRFAEGGAVDLSLRLEGLGRFRVNLHRTRRGSAAALRVLPQRIPPLTELGLPDALHDLTKAAKGLILVTGATGAGKTTTLAALVDRINRTERRHVITIEDPVEYEHPHALSLVEQIEIGADAPSFADALVAALRQDPDVLLVGEMRDYATARTALTAAETGHLVLTTLHTNDVAQTINRILDLFPAEQQGQVRQQLSLCLSAVICQQLVPRKDGAGRAAAVEILLATDPVRNHIRKGSLHQLHGEMTLGKRHGMTTMEESLSALVRAGTIGDADARLRASHPEDLRF